MTAEAAAAESVDEPIEDVQSRDRRWWPLVLVFVVAMVVTTTAAVGWILLREPPKSPEALARAELRSAQLALVNAAGAHYTGRLTADDGTSVALDLRITNVGDATGTLEFGPGKVLTYLRVDEKTFLRGDRDAWMADGSSETSAAAVAGLQILRPSRFHGIDLAHTLKPAGLGFSLDPRADAGKPVQLGASGDNRSTVISDTVTTYLASGRADRIVRPDLDIRVALLSAEDVAGFYREIRAAVAALDEAWDSETTLSSEMSWDGPCGASCTVTAAMTTTPDPFTKITVPGVTPPVANAFVWYRMEFVIGGVVVPESGCSGILEMPGNGTSTITCDFTRSPSSSVTVNLKGRPVLGRARADALLQATDGRAERSRAKSDCPIDSLTGSPKKSGC
ncbi:hypothetical protein [Nocardia sp. NPDC005366]|uniref:hypothetical protein n=1 Tax=Nocardia sp. NPDC005366 TaxID=3156878 RepID=UPI0033BA20E8